MVAGLGVFDGRRLFLLIRTACLRTPAWRPVDDIIAANPDKVAQARAKPQLVGWFVGQVMKSSGGKANPQAVNDLLKSKLGI